MTFRGSSCLKVCSFLFVLGNLGSEAALNSLPELRYILKRLKGIKACGVLKR